MIRDQTQNNGKEERRSPRLHITLYLYQLVKTRKPDVIINSEAVAFVFNAVMLNAPLEADGESVVPWVPGALTDEEQTIFRRLKKLFSFLSGNLNMQPSTTKNAAHLV